jgi:polyferredoxin
LLAVGASGLLVSLTCAHAASSVDVVRRPGIAGAHHGRYGTLENVYRLQIMNAAETEQTYHLSVKGLPQLRLKPTPMWWWPQPSPVGLWCEPDIPYGSAEPGSHKIQFEIQSQTPGQFVVEKSVFIVPR